MRKTSEPETIEHLLERLKLTSGSQLLWRNVLSRCASLEKSSFLEDCIEHDFNHKHFNTLLECLTYSKTETFSGELLTSLIERLESARPVYDGLRQSLEYLDEHQLKANPSALLAYLECVQQAIEMGREVDTFTQTVRHFLTSFGIHQAVPKTRND